jgi:ribosome recycling factor
MNYSYLPGSKLIEILQEKLSSIRTGRINSSILDSITVDAYGSKMHFVELSTITTPEAAQLLITPFDKTVLPAMEKAIIDSNLGVNPVNDGAGLRLVFPPLTEENKKQRVKEIATHLEEVKIMMRSNRQDILKKMKRDKEAGELTEDDLRRQETELQKEVDALNAEFEKVAKEKEEDLMKV